MFNFGIGPLIGLRSSRVVLVAYFALTCVDRGATETKNWVPYEKSGG